MKKHLILLSGIALVSFASLSQASDGITASPKHREHLNQYRPAAASPALHTSCPACKNEVVTRTDWTARGANKPTIKLVKHLCESCATTTVTTGQGKAVQTRVNHTCGAAAGASCCKS